jgi:hypothetical protein
LASSSRIRDLALGPSTSRSLIRRSTKLFIVEYFSLRCLSSL